MVGYFSEAELRELGFGSLGHDVRISKTATLYNRGQIHLGDHIRIDNFCVLAISGSARLSIGNYVHVSAYSFMNGLADISIENFVTLAPYSRVFSSGDDYSGTCMTGAIVPEPYRKTLSAPVQIRRHVILGTGATVLPGVSLAVGTAVGAYSLVKSSTEEFSIVTGVPARKSGMRSKQLLEAEKQFLAGGAP